jgi:hypothetical protein
MSYIVKVLKNLHLLWMGIWMHTHIISTKVVSPDLVKLAEFLGDGSVQTMPLCYD